MPRGPAAPQPAYIVDGKRRALEITPLAIEVKQPDGSLARHTFAIPWSEFGALYRLPAEPGRPEGWYAVTDAGDGNALGLDQMLAIARTKNVREFRDAMARYRGLGSQLVAGDRHGEALYIEAGPLLEIDNASLKLCGAKMPRSTFSIVAAPPALFVRPTGGRNSRRRPSCRPWPRGSLLFQQLWPRLTTIPGLRSPFDPDRPFAERTMARPPQALAAIAAALQDTVAELESLKLSGNEPWGSLLALKVPKARFRCMAARETQACSTHSGSFPSNDWPGYRFLMRRSLRMLDSEQRGCVLIGCLLRPSR